MTRTILCVLALFLGGFAAMYAPKSAKKPPEQKVNAPAKTEAPLNLGNFSVSLPVKDLAASRAFYEKLGFHVRGGMEKQRWLIMQNDTSTIGLFQGMFDKISLTYNPGWDRDKKTLENFTDVRELQKELKKRGFELKNEADESSTGPAYVTLIDPDGNPILIDQHVPKPAK